MPKDEIQAYIQASDNASDYADSMAESLEQDAREDIDDLFNHSRARDVDLWGYIGVESDTVVRDYENIPPPERGLDWVEGMAGISAAATAQFVLTNREPLIIDPVAYREQVLDGFKLTQSQLVTVGKRGAELQTTTRYVQIKSTYKAELAYLKELSNAELYEALLEYEAILPQEQLIARASGYVERMTRYPKGSPQFKEQVAKLIDTNAKGNVRQMNRRAIERIHSYREANGKGDTLMVWLTEGGKNTCSYCLDRGGTVATYAEFIDMGLPGAEVCAGGDRCRCHLAQA